MSKHRIPSPPARALALSALLAPALALAPAPAPAVAPAQGPGPFAGGRADVGGIAGPRRIVHEPTTEIEVLTSTTRDLRLRVSFPEPVYDEVLAPDGVPYTRVHVPGTQAFDGPPGLPAVPVLRTLVAVPRGAELNVVDLQAEVRGEQSLLLVPFQDLAEDGCEGEVDDYLDGNPPPDCVYDDKPFVIDDAAYGGPDTFPDFLVDLQEIGELRDLRVVQLSLPAATYEPSSGRLVLHESLQLHLEFLGGEDGFLTARSSGPFESGHPLHQAVLNSGVLYEHLLPFDVELEPLGEELLILTHPDFEDAARTLADWKKKKGIPTSVFVVADGAGPGPDTAEEIDAFIEARHAAAAVRPSYLLLVGDAEFVPTFYLQRIGKAPGTMVATDFPYANTGPDATDFLAEMATGRLSVNTQTEAERVVARIIGYEAAPPTNGNLLGDPFYSRATIASGFECCRLDAADGTTNRDFIQTSEWVRSRLVGAGKAVQRIYGEYLDGDYTGDTTPRFYRNGTPLPPPLDPASGFAWNGSGSDVVDAFNEGRFLVMHISHGYTSGWSRPGFSTSQFSSLENGEYLPVVYSLNCSTGYFDLETDSVPGSHECFAERLLLEEGGGAVGVIAGTRMTNTGLNDLLAKGFLDASWPGMLPDFGPSLPRRRLGDVLDHGKLWLFDTLGYDHWNARSHAWLYHLFGDPTMELWTKDPNAIELPDTFYVEMQQGFVDIWYETDGAMLTAWQDLGAGKVLPVGRATVVDGRASLEFFLAPDADLPLAFSASLEGAISVQLQ